MQADAVPTAVEFSKRPVIVIDTDEHRVVDQTCEAMALDTELYVRAARLVRVVVAEQVTKGAAPVTIGRLPVSTLRERLTKFMDFVKIGESGEPKAVHPPAWLVNAVNDRAQWPGLRPLEGLSLSPILRRDGTVCQHRGYDPATGVYLHLTREFPAVPETPSRDDALQAVESLLEVVADFPFAGKAHRSAYLAALLTPLARHAYHGPTPLMVFDANMRGAGKSKLCQIIVQIVAGEELPVGCSPSHEDELRKRITAAALNGDQFIVLDNISGPLGCAPMDAALTGTRWRDRKLGESSQIDMPLLAVWLATGNNIQLVADTSRRVLPIRLESPLDRPEERDNFKHPDIIGYVRRNRGELLCAALTLLRAFAVAGKPSQGLRAFGSFEGWSMLRDLLVWAGQPDPALTREGLMVFADESEGVLERLHAAIKEFDPEGGGVVIARALAALYPSSGEPPTDGPSLRLRASFEEIAGGAPGRQPSARTLGNRLKSFRRRPLKGQMLEARENAGRDGSVWTVVPAVTLRDCDAANAEVENGPGVSTGGVGTDSVECEGS